MRKSSIVKIFLLHLACLYAMLSLFEVANAQAQYKKNEDDDEADDEEDDAADILELTNDNFENLVIKKRGTGAFFIILQEPDDRKVRANIADIAKLAKHTVGTPQVARVFCNKAPMICKRLQALHEPSLPVVRIIDGPSVYNYSGSFEFE